MNRAERRRMQPHMQGNTTPEQAEAFMHTYFERLIERGAAIHLLREVLEKGVTEDWQRRTRDFLGKLPPEPHASGPAPGT